MKVTTESAVAGGGQARGRPKHVISSMHNATRLAAPYRTVFLTTGLSRRDGGPFLSVSGLARAVAGRGRGDVAVVGVYRSLANWLVDREQWSGLAVEAAGLRRFRAVEFLRQRLEHHVCPGNPPAVIHLQGLWEAASLAVERLGERRGARLVISPRGMLEPWALRHHQCRKQVALFLWQRRQLMQADLIHATSLSEKQSIRNLGFRNPVCVIPNGVEIPAPWGGVARPIGATGGDKGRFPLPGPSRPRRCLFLSRLHAQKGVPMLLEAWARVRPTGWVLEIAGGGDDGHEREVGRQITARGLADVRLIGEVTGEAKWRFLSDAELFVLPSQSENFGIAVAEAMGMGLPVITTTATPWSVLQRDRSGWWVEPAVDSLARAIREATTESPTQLAERGRRGRDYVRDHFDWGGIGQRMDACYAWVTGNGPRPEDVKLD